MHMLITEAHFGAGEALANRLATAGVRVTRCHDEVGYCRALAPGGRCPLDAPTGDVDVVVDVRGPGAELTAREYGAVCAVRAGRPVLVVPDRLTATAVVPDALRDVAHALTQDDLMERYARTGVAHELGRPGAPSA
ncbi:MAG TPA: hypothetical protein VGD67_15420 [Pseudonocardiaceae bacterium]